MNCSDALEKRLGGRDVDGAAAAHIRVCDRCRSHERLVTRLREAGAAERAVDLPVERVYETRRLVASVLSGLPAGRARRRPGLRVAVGACAVVLAVVAVINPLRPRGMPPSGRQPRSGAHYRELKFEMDDEIESLSRRVDAGFRVFRSRHLAGSATAGVERRAAALKVRIAGRVAAFERDF